MSVSVLYSMRGSGVLINASATPPTAAQASQIQTQKALVVMLDADTQALFTHNWGLDVSAPTYYEPVVRSLYAYGAAQAAGTWSGGFTFDYSNTNVLKMNKLNFLGSGGTFLVVLDKK